MTFSYLRKPLLKPSLYLVLSLVVFVLVFMQLDEMLMTMQSQQNAEQVAVEALYMDVKNTIEKIELVKRYDERFKSLSKSGVIGNQSRADWIDRLMEGVSLYGVKHANLQFSQRTPVEANQLVGVVVDPKLVHYEQIGFEGVFQHEIDFINFMNYLKEDVHELTLVQGCSMMLTAVGQQSMSDRFTFQPKEGNIQVKCQFGFVEVLSSTAKSLD